MGSKPGIGWEMVDEGCGTVGKEKGDWGLKGGGRCRKVVGLCEETYDVDHAELSNAFAMLLVVERMVAVPDADVGVGDLLEEGDSVS